MTAEKKINRGRFRPLFFFTIPALYLLSSARCAEKSLFDPGRRRQIIRKLRVVHIDIVKLVDNTLPILLFRFPVHGHDNALLLNCFPVEKLFNCIYKKCGNIVFALTKIRTP